MRIAAHTGTGRYAEELSAPPDGDLDLLLLIRHFELALLDLYSTGHLNGTTHTCLGQEYIPVALRPLLGERDFIFSNHRGHGHYLARFCDPAGLLAEIMGRDGAVGAGVGGSQHIFRDRFLATGVQGESLPVAIGAALRLKRDEPGVITVAYIGDGTWGEGAVYEALNMAGRWQLPLMVVVENNGIAQSTPTSRQLAGTIKLRAAAFDLAYQELTSIDLARLRGQLAEIVTAVRERQRPAVVEFVTTRIGPHSKGDDTRPPSERQQAQAADWYRRYAAAYPERFQRADREQRDLIAEVVRDVAGRPPSRWEIQ